MINDCDTGTPGAPVAHLLTWFNFNPSMDK